MADLLVQEIQESNSSDSVESETLKILEASQKIQQNLESDTVRNAYEEVRLATIGALQELRLSTNHDLQSFKDELANPSSNLSEGVISQEELTMIQKEFQELEQQALIEQSERLKQQVVNQFQEMFGASPEVMSFLEAQLSENSELISQESFASELLVLIAKYNRSQDEVYISPPSREDISTFYEGIQNSVSLQSNIDTVILIERFQQASTRNKELNTQMQNYRRELRDAQTEEEITRLRDIIQELETKQAYNSMQVSETAESIEGITVTSDENQVDAIKEDALAEANFELMKGKKLLQESFESLANPDGLTSESVSELFSTLYAQAEKIPELAQDLSNLVLRLLEDMKNPDSLLSRNFADLPLPENTQSDEYRTILAAKIREYDTDLDYNLETNPELAEAKADFLLILQAKAGEKLSPEELEEIFSRITQSIRSDPSSITSFSDIKALLGNDSQDPDILEAIETARKQGLAYVQKENALKMETARIHMQEISTDGIISPDEHEKLAVVQAAFIEFAGKIDGLQESILATPEELPIIMSYLEGGSIEDFALAMNTLSQSPVSETEVDSIDGGIGMSESIEEPTNQERAQETVDDLNIALETQDPEKIQTALEEAQEISDTLQTEAKSDIQLAVIETGSDIIGTEAVVERAVIGIEETARLSGDNTYLQERLGQLRTTLGNDNPLVARITTAQEEGLQKAYKNETDPSKPLPKPLEDFYSETIHAIGLTDPKEIQTLTPEELKLMRNNEKVQDGFKSFTQTLSACNLREDIFPLRHQILGVLQNEYGIAFQLNDDYLNSNEMQKLLAHIVYACKDGLPPSYTQQIQKSIFNKPLEDTTNFIKGLNTPKIVGGGLGVGAFDPAKSGLGSVFRKMFYDANNTVAPFKREKFRASLKI